MNGATALILFAVVVAIVWEGTTRFGLVNPRVLPPLTLVIAELGDLLQQPSFQIDLRDTAVRVIVAFAVAAPLALSIGFLLGEKISLGRLLSPLLHFTLAVPQSIFLPIFILVFGIGFVEKIVFGVTHAFFVIAINTVAAVRAVPRPYVTAARSFGASPVRIYRSIYVPAMLPLIVTGLRLGLIFDILGILLAEMYASQTGLGVRIFRWGQNDDVVKLMAAVLLTSVLTIAVNECMRAWEAHAGRWQRTQE